MFLCTKVGHELDLCLVVRVYIYRSGCCSGLIGYLSLAKLWQLPLLPPGLNWADG